MKNYNRPYLAAFLALLCFLNSDAVAQEPVTVPEVVVSAEEKSYDKDPIEPLNRGMHQFNSVVDDAVLAPVARGYRNALPRWGRERVSSFVDTISAPNYFINSALQGDIEGTFTAFWRFVINSTFGIAGLFDVASEAGLMPIERDFGQTLGRYGVGNQPYTVLPLLGPNNPRDTVGLIFDAVTNPFNYLTGAAVIGMRTVEAVDQRESLLDITDEIEETSLDPYASYRSLYQQMRIQEVKEAIEASEF